MTGVLDPSKTYTVQARSGAHLLIEALQSRGIDRIFCVPGESYLDAIDALSAVPQIQLVVAKHEGAAAIMAEADGKLTGRPGVCFVSRGPGATHASIGVHIASQDSTPMILLVAQVKRNQRGRDAFQEVEFREMFAPISKWVVEVCNADEIPGVIAEAFRISMEDRPGPVVIVVPEDVLPEVASVAEAAALHPAISDETPLDLEIISTELNRARRPMVIVGGSMWSDDALRHLRDFVEAHHLPVVASFRRQDLFDNNHPCYAGHVGLGLSPQLAKRIAESDLIVALGTRLGDATTQGYTLFENRDPQKQRLIHIHPSEGELGRVFRPDIAVQATPSAFAASLSRLEEPRLPAWKDWTDELRREFERFTDPNLITPTESVNLAKIVSYLSETLPPETAISNGAGNYTAWVHRFYRYKRPRTELAPTNGSMGYGLPAAIAAKLRFPDRPAICFAGDGCFLMYCQELATARQFNAPIIVLVINNGMYGTIRMHQEMRFPGTGYRTDLEGPDFIALGGSFGAHSERVKTTEEFAPAFQRALASRQLALIEICTDWHHTLPGRWIAQ